MASAESCSCERRCREARDTRIGSHHVLLSDANCGLRQGLTAFGPCELAATGAILPSIAATRHGGSVFPPPIGSLRQGITVNQPSFVAHQDSRDRRVTPVAASKPTSELCYSVRLLVPFLLAIGDSPRVPAKIMARLNALDPDQRVYVSYVHSLLEVAEQLLEDPTLGLKASEAMTTGDAGMFDFLMTSAATPRQAIAAGGRYLRLISDAHDLCLTVVEDRAVARFESRVAFPRAGEDFAIASLIRNHLFRWPEGMLEQTDAWFRHDAPKDLAPYREALGPVRPHFGAEFSAIEFPVSFLDTPLRYRDERLHTVLTKAAESVLATMPASDSLSERVRQLLSEQLGNGNVTLPVIARQLKLHPRKVSRTLLREGVSYDEIAESVRRETALHLVTNTDASISDIATQTGFAGKSPFHRAFRRWTGETPLAVRRKRRGSLARRRV